MVKKELLKYSTLLHRIEPPKHQSVEEGTLGPLFWVDSTLKGRSISDCKKKSRETLWLTNSTQTHAFASSVDFAGVALPLLAGFLFWCKTVFRGSKHQMTSDDYAKSIKSQASSAAFPVAEPSWMLKGEGLCNCCWKQSTWDRNRPANPIGPASSHHHHHHHQQRLLVPVAWQEAGKNTYFICM